ncbi:uncharacterized protein K489DRAFT_327649, partial [Dissoconium aciculare CBS 342.82]|uniref:Heterokaryon incompatibility domain-containing protein n=1 Tax=Dissoconium aciculare CBS 342.82 TaxID=1314786 RepID=A0A6J3LRC9_9PEZI
MSGSGSRSDSDFYSGLINHTPEAPVRRINVRREAIHVPLPTLSAATITQEASGFRLLKIRPNGDSHSPIHGDLTRWRIADAPDFHAISYAPGSGTAVCHVILGEANIEFAVTRHVWEVLRRMRHATAVVYVWVDVLCIDQANRLERISQVANLRQVYSRALTVRIWLGEEKRLTDGASEIDLDEALFASLAKQREPWWKQLWALQNCAYARTCPVVMLGPLKIGLDDFIMRWAAAMESLKSKTSPQEKQFLTHLRMRESLAHIQAPLELWRVRKTGNQPRKPLLYRLRETYWRQCSEPRDIIFALLDLVDEEEANKFLPDYSISFEDL